MYVAKETSSATARVSIATKEARIVDARMVLAVRGYEDARTKVEVVLCGDVIVEHEKDMPLITGAIFDSVSESHFGVSVFKSGGVLCDCDWKETVCKWTDTSKEGVLAPRSLECGVRMLGL